MNDPTFTLPPHFDGPEKADVDAADDNNASAKRQHPYRSSEPNSSDSDDNNDDFDVAEFLTEAPLCASDDDPDYMVVESAPTDTDQMTSSTRSDQAEPTHEMIMHDNEIVQQEYYIIRVRAQYRHEAALKHATVPCPYWPERPRWRCNRRCERMCNNFRRHVGERRKATKKRPRKYDLYETDVHRT